MYTWVERRRVNPSSLQETVQRAQVDFFPKLQKAPGFINFYLVADEANGINTAIIMWQDKAQADAFKASDTWPDALEQLGHNLESNDEGETVFNLDPQQ